MRARSAGEEGALPPPVGRDARGRRVEVSSKLSSKGGRSTADADSGAHTKGVSSARIAG